MSKGGGQSWFEQSEHGYLHSFLNRIFSLSKMLINHSRNDYQQNGQDRIDELPRGPVIIDLFCIQQPQNNVFISRFDNGRIIHQVFEAIK